MIILKLLVTELTVEQLMSDMEVDFDRLIGIPGRRSFMVPNIVYDIRNTIINNL